MSMPLSFCDISARYGQTPAPQKTLEEQTGWNFNQLFSDYLNKVRAQREEDEAHASEDALIAMIDAMNAPKEDRQANQDKTAVQALMKAGPALLESEKFKKLRVQFEGEIDVTVMPEIRALMATLGDASSFKQVDDIQEEQKEQKELAEEKERLEVTEAHSPSETSDPDTIGKEV